LPTTNGVADPRYALTRDLRTGSLTQQTVMAGTQFNVAASDSVQ